MTIRFKICCIEDTTEAGMAVRAGASAVGLVSAMPSGPGVIGEADIAAIARQVPPGVARFLLTSATHPGAIIAQQRRCGVDAIQLVVGHPPAVRRELRRALPGVSIVQVVHVTGPSSVDEAREAAETSDALLLDSGRPDAATPELGGTGRVHDWSVSREIVRAVACPVFLAGGLRPSNVREAIRAVRPFGVDVCSGVRREGRLDQEALAAFSEEVRRA